MKKKKVAMCVFVLFAFNTALFAVDSIWDGDAGDGLWSTVTNWADDSIPPNGNRIIVNLDQEVTFDVASVYYPNKLIVEAATVIPPGATISFPSGTLVNGSYWYVGGGAGQTGTINITGADCDITTRDMNLGAGNGTGYLNMSAGELNVTGSGTGVGLSVPFDATSMGELRLTGGTIIAQQLTMYDYGLIDISGNGLLQLAGDQKTLVQGYAGSGLIKAEAGTKDVTILYDGGNTFVMSPDNTDFLVNAWAPMPPNGSFTPEPEAMLTWSPGAFALKHNVYLGIDKDNLTLHAENITEASVSTGVLNFGTEYFWRVDELGSGSEVWTGNVCSFTTRGTLAIEEFEFYAADPNMLEVWSADGGASIALATSTTQGLKSLELSYDNSLAPYYSQAFYAPQNIDFTIYGVASLDIWYYGDASNSAEKMYVILDDGTNFAVLQNDDVVTLSASWNIWRVALSDFTVANPALDMTSIDTLTLGVGQKASPQAGGSGIMYIDNLRLWETRCLYPPEYDFTGDCVVDIADFAKMAATWLEDGRFPQ